MKTRDMGAGSMAIVLALLLAGCGGLVVNEKSNRIKLASDPAGATVYANGAELGVTPLEIAPAEHFASGFVGLSYRYYGKLSFRKPGCETYAVDVDDHLLGADIQARLKCDPDYRAPAAGRAPQAAAETYSGRLERIEALRKQGLISPEEYKHLRQRILDEL
ncbi:MAG: PEGA domain-containing protein [Hydrogenophilaceae bacterium]